MAAITNCRGLVIIVGVISIAAIGIGKELKPFPKIKFLGIDVVPEMIAFAREKCGRSDWRFVVVQGLTIPEDDGVADYVPFFSVITHLSAEESFVTWWMPNAP